MRLIAVAALLMFAAGERAADDAPRGMVAHFAGDACPDGWQPFELGRGRVIVAVTDASAIGRTVGTALAGEEDRVHGHALVGSIDLPARSIAAADGPNDSGAASGAQAVGGAAAPAPSGLPFVQLMACVKP